MTDRSSTAPPSRPAPRFRAIRSVALILCAAAMMHGSGCASDPAAGYSTRSLHSESLRTIAVPIFRNDTFDRGVEFALTEAVIKEIESRTRYKVTTQTRADSILSGRVSRVERRQLSRSRLTGLGEEVAYLVTIDFEWRDLHRDVPLIVRSEFTGQGMFHPSRPIGESEETGRFGAVQILARDIVNEMQSNW